MTYSAKVLADSSYQGVRLLTLEVQFPRFILAEFNTHRMFSRNSASSRAIPVETRIQQVIDNPFVPESYGQNKRGMQQGASLEENAQAMCRGSWLEARDACVAEAQLHVRHGAHKQHANRLIELWAWHTAVVSSTEWENFLRLRDHHAAQPEMQITARKMREAIAASRPRELDVGEWHLPYVTEEDRVIYAEGGDTEDLRRVSVVRCAAVSFERQGAHRTPEQIDARHDAMRASAHWSPFEHPAKIASVSEIRQHALYRLQNPIFDSEDRWEPVFIGNFAVPFLQYRKTFAGESVWTGDA